MDEVDEAVGVEVVDVEVVEMDVVDVEVVGIEVADVEVVLSKNDSMDELRFFVSTIFLCPTLL